MNTDKQMLKQTLKQALPIGIQDFETIRDNSKNYVYVDKTDKVLELLEHHKYVFLSRPRRFGKSLFLSTLEAVFKGKKDLFTGLFIADKYDWSQNYPVIKLSFNGKQTSKKAIQQGLMANLLENYTLLGLENALADNYPETEPSVLFEQLISLAYRTFNQAIVILIDEYDKPILDNLTDLAMAEYARHELRGLYSVIKDNDRYIHFCFLTGVSKFSKAGVFSGLNNLNDISLMPRYGDICGYTQNDIETTFMSLLQGVDLANLREWYNGYNFLGEAVYNPFDILLFIDNNHRYLSYWQETGTPNFLYELLELGDYPLPDIDNLHVGSEIISSFDVKRLNLLTLLFQAGYLTIDKEYTDELTDEPCYQLRLPNKEVALAYHRQVLSLLTGGGDDTRLPNNNARKALLTADIPLMFEVLRALFADIPYQNYNSNYIAQSEGHYAAVFNVFFKQFGYKNIKTEQSTNTGRIDMSMAIKDSVYIMEFKVDADPEKAMKQMIEKQYYQPFMLDYDKANIWLIGITFSARCKNVSHLEYQNLQDFEGGKATTMLQAK